MNWDYIAGFFDGEGNVNISKISKLNGKFSYFIQVRLYNSQESVIMAIREFVKMGNIYRFKRPANSNFVFELTITNKKDIKTFLTNLVDKLVIKKEIVSYILTNFSFERDNNNNFDLSVIRNLNQRNKNNIIKALTE